MLSLETELDYLWRIHQALSNNGDTETTGQLVEIAVEYAFLTGLTDPARAAWSGGAGESNPLAPDIKAEAAKILGTIRETQRFGDGPEFTEHTFKTLLKHIHYDGLNALQQLRESD